MTAELLGCCYVMVHILFKVAVILASFSSTLARAISISLSSGETCTHLRSLVHLNPLLSGGDHDIPIEEKTIRLIRSECDNGGIYPRHCYAILG